MAMGMLRTTKGLDAVITFALDLCPYARTAKRPNGVIAAAHDLCPLARTFFFASPKKKVPKKKGDFWRNAPHAQRG